MKTIVEIEWDSNKPLRELNISVALQTYFTGECFTVRELPAQMEGEENDSTKAFRRALEEIKTGLKNAGFKRTVAEIQALLDDYPVIQQPIPAKVDPMSGPIPVKTLAIIEGLEDQKLSKVDGKSACVCQIGHSATVCKSFISSGNLYPAYCECGHHKSCHAQGEKLKRSIAKSRKRNKVISSPDELPKHWGQFKVNGEWL